MLAAGSYITTVIDAARHHLPLDKLPDPVIVGVGMATTGLVLSLWGARLIRPLLTLAFLCAGAWVGTLLAHRVGVSPIAGVIVAAVVCCVIGYTLYRLWVGAVVAAVLMVVTLSIYAHSRVLPHWIEFSRTSGTAGRSTVDEFAIPPPEQQQQTNQGDARALVGEFVEYLEAREPTARRDIIVIAIGAAAAGVLLGIVAGRLATVLWSSLVGVCLMAGGVMILLAHWRPEWLDLASKHPSKVGASLLVAWVLAMVRQMTGFRRLSPRPVPEANGNA